MPPLTPNSAVNTQRWTNPRVDIPTIYLVGDTHYGSAQIDEPLGDPNTRQIAAINTLRGAAHPLGGYIDEPLSVIQLGDAVHEDFENAVRFEADYDMHGKGTIRFPCRVFDGNHDQAQVRNLIRRIHGELNWGFELAGYYFQTVTENYTAPNVTTPPTAAQLAANIGPKLNARPVGEPKFLMFHRSVSSAGYLAEWAADALDTLEGLCLAYNVVGIIHGHDHYSHHGTWRGIQVLSPGSVQQAGTFPGYTTTYPESFIVLRLGQGFYDAACRVFGYDVNRVWAADTWEWSVRVDHA